MPVAPALLILFQIERHDSELHRPCSAAPHDPAMLRTIPLSRRGVYRVRCTQRTRVSTIALWALRHPARRPRGSRGESAGPSLGVDPVRPALKLPALGRLRMAGL